MDSVSLAVLLTIATAATALGTGIIRAVKLKKESFDEINERSSHTVPTPRGGGASLSIVFVLGIGALFFMGKISWEHAAALGIGGGVIATMGYVDDLIQLPWKLRFLVQLGCSAAAVWLTGGMETLTFGDQVVNLGWFGSAAAVITCVWLINLFNFMDGIDGISGSQGLLIGVMSGVLLFAIGQPGPAIASLLLAACCLGFLVWNWPPAKIFMGDVGSTLLGFCFAVLALIGMKSGIGMFVWLLVLGAFFTDATLTLLLRGINKEEVTRPHRSHAFQVMSRKLQSHGKVTLFYALINVLAFFPLAYFAWMEPNLAPFLSIPAILAFGAWVYWMRGGVKGPSI